MIALARSCGGNPESSAPSNAEMDKAPQGIRLMPIKARQIVLLRSTSCRRSGTVTSIEMPYPVKDSSITPIPSVIKIIALDGAKLKALIASPRAPSPPLRLLTSAKKSPKKITTPTSNSRTTESATAWPKWSS